MSEWDALENMIATLNRLGLTEDVEEDFDDDFWCCADCDGWGWDYGDDEDDDGEY